MREKVSTENSNAAGTRPGPGGVFASGEPSPGSAPLAGEVEGDLRHLPRRDDDGGGDGEGPPAHGETPGTKKGCAVDAEGSGGALAVGLMGLLAWRRRRD